MLAKFWHYSFNKQKNNSNLSIVCKIVCRENSQLTVVTFQLLSVDLNMRTHKQLENLRASTSASPVVEIAFFFAP